ncbi:MAG: hypothetical protein IPL78_12285 [Chloroflexi bacterium]|nr:hypothetical protein [Chloroflexota bacterium]
MSNQVDTFLSPALQAVIEQKFYAQINQNCRLEQLLDDPAFLQQPNKHVGLFADHGVVHVRDVAQQVLTVLQTAHGVLIPIRTPERLARMQALGVLLAYWHDVGMVDFSAFGRKMHPERASQLIFAPDMDEWLAQVWQEDRGRVATTLTTLVQETGLTLAPPGLLREILALAMAHSKSKVPMACLNDATQLRTRVLFAAATDLQHQYNPQTPPGPPNPHLARFYTDYPTQAFAWLMATHPAWQELTQDVVDTLRALRCADSLRQRGTVLKTSGGYEIFLNQETAHAVFALRRGPDRLYLLEMPDMISSGEANIASSEMDPAGDLRISLHRGRFVTRDHNSFAARCAAIVIQDIQADTIASFQRPDSVPGLKTAAEVLILLEETDDNLAFTELVRDELSQIDDAAAQRIRIVPSLHNCSLAERELYVNAEPLDWSSVEKETLLTHLQKSGHPIAQIDRSKAFHHVRLTTLNAGQTLIEAGAPSGFVYLPLGLGLKIIPMGGYAAFSVTAWMPLGVTGVIRGDVRNAFVVAEEPIDVLIIPQSVYLKRWHTTHSHATFLQAVGVGSEQ